VTIFKETVDEEILTISEARELLADVEADRATDEERELRYELARAIEHVDRFAVLDAAESRDLVEELLELEQVGSLATAVKIADLLPRNRDELRAVFAQERYALSGDELDELLNVVAKYA